MTRRRTIVNKTELTISIEEKKLEAISFWLKKENATVQKKMDEALRELYEQTVPEAVREYLERKAAPARERPKRPAKSTGAPAMPAETEERSQE